jgi:uncharacterized membrane protein
VTDSELDLLEIICKGLLIALAAVLSVWLCHWIFGTATELRNYITGGIGGSLYYLGKTRVLNRWLP